MADALPAFSSVRCGPRGWRRAAPALRALIAALPMVVICMPSFCQTNAGISIAASRRCGPSPRLAQLRRLPLVPRRARGGDEDVAIAGSDLEVGQELQAVVVHTDASGATVETTDGLRGVVPLQSLQSEPCDCVEDVVIVGQRVTVWVSAVASEELRFTMVRKEVIKEQPPAEATGADSAAPSAAEEAASLRSLEATSDKTWLSGEVKDVSSTGVFVSVKPPGGGAPATGLVHRSKLGQNPKVFPYGAFYARGDKIKVRILRVMPNGRLELSLAKVGNEATAFEKIPKNASLAGKVIFTHEQLGTFVEVEHPDPNVAGAIGLLHKTQSAVPLDQLVCGQEIEVKVLSVDVDSNRLKLTDSSSDIAKHFQEVNTDLKRLSLSTLDPSENVKDVSALEENRQSGELITATVERLLVSGVIVRVQARLDDPSATRTAFLHSSEITGDQTIELGKEISVRVKSIELATRPAKVQVTCRPSPLSEEEWVKLIKAFEGHEYEFFPARVVAVGNDVIQVAVAPPQGDAPQADVVGYLSESRSSSMTVGQEIEVRTRFVQEKSISFTAYRPNPRTVALVKLRSLPDTEWLDGKVLRLTNAGAIVSVPVPGDETMSAEGLLPITRLLEGRVPEDVGLVLEKDQTATIRVESVELGGSRSGRLLVTMLPKDVVPAARPRPTRKRTRAPATEETFKAMQEVGSSEWLEGKVVGVASFGAFVAVTPPGGKKPMDGLVRVANIKEGFLPEVSLELSIGQEVKVRKLSLDGKPGASKDYRLQLTMLPEGSGEKSA